MGLSQLIILLGKEREVDRDIKPCKRYEGNTVVEQEGAQLRDILLESSLVL